MPQPGSRPTLIENVGPKQMLVPSTFWSQNNFSPKQMLLQQTYFIEKQFVIQHCRWSTNLFAGIYSTQNFRQSKQFNIAARIWFNLIVNCWLWKSILKFAYLYLYFVHSLESSILSVVQNAWNLIIIKNNVCSIID